MSSRRENARGARLNLPRDLAVAYTVARMGAATVSDLVPLFFGAESTARWGVLRLERLGILRSFERRDKSQPKWLSTTKRGLEWVMEETGANEDELRLFTGLRRVNLDALRMRNRLWTSTVLAARANGRVALERFLPEWCLRSARPEGVAIVPDALLVVEVAGCKADRRSHAWMVELDSGSERRAIWRAKAAAYRAARARSTLYGQSSWSVLAVVPSERRARSIASAVVDGGAGAFAFFGVEASLCGSRAFDPVLVKAADLVPGREVAPRGSLIDRFVTPSDEPHQEPPTTAVGGSCVESGGTP